MIFKLALSISAGEFCCIIGKSGSGKTTLLNLLGLLDLPDQGSCVINGQPLNHLTPKELSIFRRQNIGFIFQNYQLLPHLSVLDNVALSLLYNGKGRSASHRAAQEILTSLEIGDLSARLPKQLSGGQPQRVAIARALANNPPIILADEPTGNLDQETAKMVLGLLREINQKHNTTIIIVTHDTSITSYADHTYRLQDGRLLLMEGNQL
ncbi:MAG: ABC transporter ATP-binding protein [Emcibacter sp.]|nr:ABC transporter ATP-binding protein [Emcibacter sp.]